jgi:hypothetical protein
MTTSIDHQSHQINTADKRYRQLNVMHIILAGAAALTMFALFDAGSPSAAQTVASASVRLTDVTTDLPVRASAPFGPLNPPGLVGGAGFAADDTDNQAQQQIQQAEQQAEQQQEVANQEAQQAEQQGLQVEQQATLSTP